MPARIKTTSPALTNQERDLGRYRLTEMAIEEDGKRVFQLWEPPLFRFEQLGDQAIVFTDYTIHIVGPSEVGRLDNIAKTEYGDKSLWWVLAHVNNIAHPMDDLFPGQQLIVPLLEDVIASVSGQEV